jgi:hypothetical protein
MIDDVRRHHPGDLILRAGETALHMRQRDIGDRRVDALHERRQHDRRGDRGAIGPQRRHLAAGRRRGSAK